MSFINGSQTNLHPTDTARWQQIQKDTFTNWVNEQLKPRGSAVRDLRTDLSDGVLLVTLVEALQRSTLTRAVTRPTNQYEKLQNITVALDAISRDNVRIINIDSKEVLEGNTKLILALVWQLVLRYQIGLSNIQHRHWMLAWLQAVIPECNITNFTTDWNDGIALFALLDFCVPGLCPNWKSIDRFDKENNCRKAMKIARQQFGIPLILRPEYLSNPELDEMSAITYLSYFLKVGAPGHNATLQRIQPLVRNTPVFNFTTDWNNGRVLCELVTNLGVTVPNWPEGNASSIELLQEGLDAGVKLNVSPIVTAADMAEETSEHLGIMAYAAQFIRLSPVAIHVMSNREHKQQEMLVVEKRVETTQSRNGGSVTIKHHRQRSPSPESSHNASSLPRSSRNQGVVSSMYTTSQKTVVIKHHNSGDPSVMVNNHNDNETTRRVYSLMNAKPNDKPKRSFSFVRTPSLRKAKKDNKNDDDSDVTIDTFSVGAIMTEKTYLLESKDAVRLEAVSPTGRVIKMTGDGYYNAQFAPEEVGKWNLSLYCNDKVVNSCPIDVCDPSQVKVSGIKPGLVGKAQKFLIDCSKAGSGEVEVDISHRKGAVHCYLKEPSPNVFQATFTPYYTGIYKINVSYNKADIRDSDYLIAEGDGMHRRAVFSTEMEEETDGALNIRATCDWQIDYVTGVPFEVKMTDKADVKVYSMMDGSICNTPHLIADCSHSPDGNINAEVAYQGFRFPADVEEDKPNVYRISFRPRGPGTYRIWITYDGHVVQGCPFIQEIDELVSPTASGEGLVRAIEGLPATFNIDARGFPGNMTVSVKGPSRSINCKIDQNSDGTHTVTYTPQENGTHWIHIQLDGKEIEKSPFKPRVVNPNKVRVSGGWRPLMDERERIPLIVNKEKQLPFDASDAGVGELTAEIHGPSNESVAVTIDSRKGAQHTVIFTPREEGKHYIDVKWNGYPLPKTPYLGLATIQPDSEDKPSFQSIILLKNPDRKSDSESSDESDPEQKRKRIIVRKIQSTDSPDSLKKPPNRKIQVFRHSSDVSSTPSKRIIVSRHQPSLRSATTVSDTDSVPRGPRISAVYVPDGPSGSTSPKSSRPPSYKDKVDGVKNQYLSPKVILSGPGLKKASVNRTAVFVIDGRQAPPGVPEVKMSNVRQEIPVDCQPDGPQVYKCTYVPPVAGSYLLDIKWNKRPLKCCPLKISVNKKDDRSPSVTSTNTSTQRPRKASSVPGDKPNSKPVPTLIKEGVVGKPVTLRVDPRKYGPGELKVDCTGPHGENLPVITTPHDDGTIGVQLRPVGPGRHILNIRFNNKHIFDSPYAIDISLDKKYGPVTVYGPGIQNGILPGFNGQFWVDARNAGTGELYVSIMGPKGAFRVEMTRQSQKTKLFDCLYHPTEPGVYTVNVLWSGVHVSDSPYIVLLGISNADLDRMVLERKASLLPMPKTVSQHSEPSKEASSASLLY